MKRAVDTRIYVYSWQFIIFVLVSSFTSEWLSISWNRSVILISADGLWCPSLERKTLYFKENRFFFIETTQCWLTLVLYRTIKSTFDSNTIRDIKRNENQNLTSKVWEREMIFVRVACWNELKLWKRFLYRQIIFRTYIPPFVYPLLYWFFFIFPTSYAYVVILGLKAQNFIESTASVD